MKSIRLMVCVLLTSLTYTINDSALDNCQNKADITCNYSKDSYYDRYQKAEKKFNELSNDHGTDLFAHYFYKKTLQGNPICRLFMEDEDDFEDIMVLAVMHQFLPNYLKQNTAIYQEFQSLYAESEETDILSEETIKQALRNYARLGLTFTYDQIKDAHLIHLTFFSFMRGMPDGGGRLDDYRFVALLRELFLDIYSFTFKQLKQVKI